MITLNRSIIGHHTTIDHHNINDLIPLPRTSSSTTQSQNLKSDPSHPDTLLSKHQRGINVKYTNSKGDCVDTTIDSRAGKVKGKYPLWWNTTFNNGVKEPIDFSKVSNLQLVPPSEPTNDVFVANTKEVVKEAKQKELT